MCGAQSQSISLLDVSIIDGDLERTLAMLHNLREAAGENWFSSVDISNNLLGDYGIKIHWRTIDKLLSSNPNLVSRRKRSKRWYYILLADGEDLVSIGSSRIRIIRPEQAVEATISLHDLLSSLSGTIRICDPYIDAKSLEHLDSCSTSSSIKLLTMNLKDSGKLRRLYQAFPTKGTTIEIRVVTSRDIHDRYVIDDQSMFILGTSFNGFAKKQSFIIEAGEDIRSTVLSEFNSRWSQAKSI